MPRKVKKCKESVVEVETPCEVVEEPVPQDVQETPVEIVKKPKRVRKAKVKASVDAPQKAKPKSKWVEHCMAYKAKNGCTYRQSLSLARDSYKK